MNKIKNWFFQLVENIYKVIKTIVIFFVQLLFDIINQVLGTIPKLIVANAKIKRKIDNLKNTTIKNEDSRLKLSLKFIKQYFSSEIERLNRIEDKARSTIIGVTIAISIITGPSLLLPSRLDEFNQQPCLIKWLFVISLLLAVFFLLISGYLSFLAFRVGQVSKPLLVNGSGNTTKIEEKKLYIKFIETNKYRIMQRSNFLAASMDCLRNGLVLFFTLLVFSCYSFLF